MLQELNQEEMQMIDGGAVNWGRVALGVAVWGGVAAAGIANPALGFALRQTAGRVGTAMIVAGIYGSNVAYSH
ncbi:class IIb bacteriocin, lactobin A/cerein 7B family [Effusibacillus consociatus]|uniref:Class IIb bacteriocin, lactobin A/cerein 7B family n=1 Tax=Effusibacillus consociatus TaxID=1117041 RepID=A0ABV9Q8A9_9BACL